MADRIRKVDYYALKCPNKPGAGAEMLAIFKKERVSFAATSKRANSARVHVEAPVFLKNLKHGAHGLGAPDFDKTARGGIAHDSLLAPEYLSERPHSPLAPEEAEHLGGIDTEAGV